MTLGNWLKQAEHTLKESGVASARLDARVLAGYVLKRDKSWLLAHDELRLKQANKSRLDKLLAKRLKRQPLAYIVGKKEFYGLMFEVSSRVLVPRPETEEIVETAKKIARPNCAVLEVGTGSGAIAVALKRERPDVHMIATDISAAALKIAEKNAKSHKVDIEFIVSDLFDKVTGRFDLVLANLPYVPIGTRAQPELGFEPELALYAGADGLDYYRVFIKQLPNFLEPNGQAIIEAGPTQRTELQRLAVDSNLVLESVSEYVSILK